MITYLKKIVGIGYWVALFYLIIHPYVAAQDIAPIQDATAGITEKSYVIGPNNLLQIKILGEEGIQSTFRVDDSGYISHPLAGRIKIGGNTVSQAENMLTTLFRGDYILNPQVSIFVIEHSHYSILGEVRKPGNYELTGRLSLVEAISIAGGFTPVANDKKVKILRRDDLSGNERTITLNVDSLMEGREKTEDAYIQAGDVIQVPKSFF